MKQKPLAIIITAALSLGLLAGCGQSSAPAKTEAAGTAFEVATVRWADWGEDYHTGMPDKAAAELGITINWDTLLNSDWADKKAVLMAGNELPDAFMGSICFSESDIQQNIGSFIQLDEYIDKYMPNLKAILDSDPTMKALATSSDGHIYGLPAKKPCRPTVANQMFINQTWLDNLGLSMPTTYDEFVEVLRAFKEQDANGNGDANDEIPFGQGYADSVYFYCLPFGTNVGADGTYDMAIKDGKPVYLPISDSYKAGIKAMSEAYAEGLIDQELFTEDTSMRDAKLMNETPIVGVAPGWTADSTFGANAGQYVALPALKGPDGKAYVSSDPEHSNYSRYEFMVTTACADPGTLLSWVDTFYTEDASIQNFYGEFDKAIAKADDGTYTVLEPNDGNSADTFAWVNSLRDFGPKYVQDGFNAKVKYAGANGDASKLALDTEFAPLATQAYPNVSYEQDQLAALSILFVDIDAYVNTMQATWVTEGGVDEQWDAYIAQLEAMGLSNFTGIMQAAFDTYEASK